MGRRGDGLGERNDALSRHPDGLVSHSDRLNRHSDGLPGHSDGLGRHFDALGVHSDGLGRHPDGLGSHSDGLGRHVGDLGRHPDERQVPSQTVFTRFQPIRVKTQAICGQKETTGGPPHVLGMPQRGYGLQPKVAELDSATLGMRR